MTDDRETRGRTHRTVKKGGGKKQVNRVFPNLRHQKDMGPKQTFSMGCSVLNGQTTM